MLGAAGFITPVLVTYLGSTAGISIAWLLAAGGAIDWLLIMGLGTLPISSEFFRLLWGGSGMVVVVMPGDWSRFC